MLQCLFHSATVRLATRNHARSESCQANCVFCTLRDAEAATADGDGRFSVQAFDRWLSARNIAIDEYQDCGSVVAALMEDTESAPTWKNIFKNDVQDSLTFVYGCGHCVADPRNTRYLMNFLSLSIGERWAADRGNVISLTDLLEENSNAVSTSDGLHDRACPICAEVPFSFQKQSIVRLADVTVCLLYTSPSPRD